MLSKVYLFTLQVLLYNVRVIQEAGYLWDFRVKSILLCIVGINVEKLHQFFYQTVERMGLPSVQDIHFQVLCQQ